MAHSVISISRSLAAGGEQIGRIVAESLGLRYADEEIVARAADRAGVSPEVVERAEQTPGLVTRIIESMASAPGGLEGLPPYAVVPVARSATYLTLIEQVIRETALEGSVVIVAHGASIALAGTDGLLRVLVTASPVVRAQRLARDARLDGQKAEKAIEDSDRQRREYLRRFYDVSQELPTHYDLVVNTDAMTLPQAAQLVLMAARA